MATAITMMERADQPDKRIPARTADLETAGRLAIERKEWPPGTRVLSTLTVEQALYIGLLLVALGFRLHDLTALPLGVEESARALGAWSFLRGESPVAWDEPALEVLTALVFFLFGASDLASRVLPVLTGVALVASCWLVREHLGRMEALLGAFLLAVSPLFVYYSRSLSPEIFAALLSLALLSWLLQYLNEGHALHIALSALGMALLLLLGATGVQMALTLFLATVCLILWRSGFPEEVLGRIQKDSDAHSIALSILVGTLLLIGSGLLAYPQGLGLPSLRAWIEQFSIERGGLPWHYHFWLLIAYEPLIALTGIIGVALILWRWRRWNTNQPSIGILPRLLVIWSVLAIVLLLAIGRKSSGQLLSLLLPLSLLGGISIAALLRRVGVFSPRRIVPFALALVILGVSFYIALSFITHPGINIPWVREPLLIMAASMLGFLGLQAWGRLKAIDVPYLGLMGVLVLTAIEIHGIVRLRYPTAPELLVPAPTSPAVAKMVRRIDEIYWRLQGRQEVRTAVEAGLRYPFAWYLREHPRIAFTQRIEPGPTVVVVSGSQPDSRFIRYTVERGRLLTPILGGLLSPGQLWRWWAFGEGPGIGEQELVMYIGG